MSKEYSSNPSCVKNNGSVSPGLPASHPIKKSCHVSLDCPSTGPSHLGANRIPCPPVVVDKPVFCSTGLDFLKVSLWLDWNDGKFLERLHSRKTALQDTDYLEGSFEDTGGFKFNLSRTGAGKYTYVLKSGDVSIMFSNHKHNAPFPNCRIEIGSASCWSPGWEYVFTRITSWIKIYGGIIRQEKVSECHIASDLLDVNFSESGFTDRSRWITRANKWSLHGTHNTPNYISFGKGDMMLRVYDKTAEIKGNSPKCSIFYTIWHEITNRIPEHVTRVEFQLRRPVLKELNINTVKELRRKLNSLWKYCVTDWCRFCKNAVDRKNKNQLRSKLADIWLTVQGLTFKKGRVYKMTRNKTCLTDIDQLKKQAAGCLLSVCAALGHASDDLTGHITTSFNFIEEQIRENFRLDYDDYIRKMEVKLNRAYIGV